MSTVPATAKEFWPHSGDEAPDSALSTEDVERVREFVRAGEEGRSSPDIRNTWPSLLPKIYADPRHGDCQLLLATTLKNPEAELKAYDDLVHAYTVATLFNTLPLISDVNHKNRARLLVPIKALGRLLNSHGGMPAMRAAYYVVSPLLQDVVSYTEDGEEWTRGANSVLSNAWDGIGRWMH